MSEFGDSAELHAEVMAILWGPVANVSIFIMQYSYRRYPFFIHAIFGLVACGVTLGTAIPMLMYTGIVSTDSTISQDFSGSTLNSHYLVGITCLIVITVEVILGVVTKVVNFTGGRSKSILNLKKVHQILGFMILILCKSNIYIIAPDQYGLLAQDIAFVLLIIGWKLFFPRMESKIGPFVDKTDDIPSITSISTLSKANQYCIFSNYVYDLAPISRVHPAGFEVIESVKNKEIDRYVYGMYSSEILPAVPKHSHSSKFLSLLDNPVAKISIPAPFDGFEGGKMLTKIETISIVSSEGNIYEMKLKKCNGPSFYFQGYSMWEQLGRYYTITLFNKTTRLYTSVNFLVKDNKIFMNNLFNLGNYQKLLQQQVRLKQIELGEYPSKKIMGQTEVEEDYEYLPILFKMYKDGKFTESLVKQCQNRYPELLLSQPQGEGLQLASAMPGKIIIVAGGTGIYPFSDLIDLLFKELLIKMRPELTDQICRLSPILKYKSFDQFSFHLMAAFRDLADIHPVTFEQLLCLSNYHPRFIFTAKIGSDNRARLQQSKVNIHSGSFGSLVSKELQSAKQISKIYVCGPPRMNEQFSNILQQSFLEEENYLIL